MKDLPHVIEPETYDLKEDISLKATTSEKMGFVGREEGMAVHAVALITKA